VDIYFEADNGKIDLSAAPEEVLTNFFSLWTGDVSQGQLISAAIEDWRDPDNEVRPNGAEAPFYSSLNFAPRNSSVGIADASLIRGIPPDDFRLKFLSNGREATMREGLDAYITFGGVGSTINPNFASDLVLRSIPGLSESDVASILLHRKDRLFSNADELQSAGLRPDSPAWRYLSFVRSVPAIRVNAKLKSNVLRSERRVAYRYSAINLVSGQLETKSALGRIERIYGE
jgi:hypothetical protein